MSPLGEGNCKGAWQAPMKMSKVLGKCVCRSEGWRSEESACIQ